MSIHHILKDRLTLTCLRTTVDKLDKLDVDKLEAVTVDLKELSDTVEKEVLN